MVESAMGRVVRLLHEHIAAFKQGVDGLADREHEAAGERCKVWKKQRLLVAY